MASSRRARTVLVTLTLLPVITGCGDDGQGTINVAAINCQLVDELDDGVLTIATERGRGSPDLNCVLGEVADTKTISNLYLDGVDPQGELEVDDGIWASWSYASETSFTWKFGTSRDAVMGS